MCVPDLRSRRASRCVCIAPPNEFQGILLPRCSSEAERKSSVERHWMVGLDLTPHRERLFFVVCKAPGDAPSGERLRALSDHCTSFAYASEASLVLLVQMPRRLPVSIGGFPCAPHTGVAHAPTPEPLIRWRKKLPGHSCAVFLLQVYPRPVLSELKASIPLLASDLAGSEALESSLLHTSLQISQVHTSLQISQVHTSCPTPQRPDALAVVSQPADQDGTPQPGCFFRVLHASNSGIDSFRGRGYGNERRPFVLGVATCCADAPAGGGRHCRGPGQRGTRA